MGKTIMIIYRLYDSCYNVIFREHFNSVVCYRQTTTNGHIMGEEYCVHPQVIRHGLLLLPVVTDLIAL